MSLHLEKASGKGVAERWKRQYCKNGSWGKTISGDTEIVYKRLLALGDDPSPEAVAEIMDGKAWSFIWCSNCCDYHRQGVTFDAGDYEATLCHKCTSEALSLFDVEDLERAELARLKAKYETTE